MRAMEKLIKAEVNRLGFDLFVECLPLFSLDRKELLSCPTVQAAGFELMLMYKRQSGLSLKELDCSSHSVDSQKYVVFRHDVHARSIE